MTLTDEVTALKERHHATWAAGNYALVAQLVEGGADACVEAAMITPEAPVLDVATGTGNTAIVAARHGGIVTGLDLTPELFDTARRRAGEWGVEVDWVEGDAEDLPFADHSFTRVLSTFGVQFAPRHDLVARELVRVCRPGGRIILCNWTSEGKIGELFRLMGRYLPAPPPFVKPPPLWGDEAHVTQLFEGLGVSVRFDRMTMSMAFDTPEEYIAFFEAHYGPTIKAKEVLDPLGRWAPLRAEWLDLVRRFHRNGAVEQEYFVVTARVR